MSCMMPFIFWAPWLTPMAKIRNGTRMEYGLSSKPSGGSAPISQTTPTRVVASTSRVLRRQRVKA
ncbi:hypothetical protein D3C85_1576000 [compost metagenome]